MSAKIANDVLNAEIYAVFTAPNAARTSYEKGVRLSVYLSVGLSVKRLDCDKTKERFAHILIPYERSLSVVV